MANPQQLRAVEVNGEVHIPTRQEIRAYIAEHARATLAVAAAGGNQFHFLLDHQDQVQKFAATLPPIQREEFMRVYVEETSAALEGLKTQVAVKEARELETATTVSNDGRAFTVAVVVVVIFALVVATAWLSGQ